MKPAIAKLVVPLILITTVIPVANAGSQANAEPNFEQEKIVEFAKKVERVAAEKGARVIIVSRIGRPREEMPDGVEYTHTAFGVYSMITTAEGKVIPGYAMYNLYQKSDKPDESELVVDYPVDFFMGVHELKAGMIIPTPEMQMKLLKVVGSDTYTKLHNPRYSVIANPFTEKYQNCTEYTLDVITASVYDTDDLRVIKANLKAYYQPYELDINPLKLMLGSMTKSEVAVSDHDGKILMATYESIVSFMEENALAQDVMTVF